MPSSTRPQSQRASRRIWAYATIDWPTQCDQYREAFDTLIAGSDLPFADPAGVPTLLMAQDCRRVVDTVLDGTGGDELAGEMPARYIRIATQYAAVLPRPLRRAGVALLRRLPRIARYTPILDFDDPEELLIRWKGWTRAEIEALCGSPVSFEHTHFFQTYRRFSRCRSLRTQHGTDRRHAR